MIVFHHFVGLINIRSEIWRQSLIRFFFTVGESSRNQGYKQKIDDFQKGKTKLGGKIDACRKFYIRLDVGRPDMI